MHSGLAYFYCKIIEMGQKKPKILIIDDLSTHLFLMKSLLEEEGYEIEVQKDPVLALKNIEENIPDLVLLDIMMPDMDGYEVLRKLKKKKTTESIPVIIISAVTNHKGIKKAFAAGAEDYLTKPINTIDLRVKVKAALTEE